MMHYKNKYKSQRHYFRSLEVRCADSPLRGEQGLRAQEWGAYVGTPGAPVTGFPEISRPSKISNEDLNVVSTQPPHIQLQPEASM